MGKRLFAILMIALAITYSVFAIIIINQKETIKDKDIEISDLRFEKAKLQGKCNSANEAYDFYHSYVAICDDDSDYYHTYECSDWKQDSFYLYNIENAESLGYKPCPKCHK